MEAQGDPLKGVLPTLQTSLTHLELPCTATAGLEEKISHVFRKAVAVQGSFWWIGRCAAVKSAASRLFGGWGAFRGYALHECRDPACGRPCGVRLRGGQGCDVCLFARCAAPLRMTQRV